MEWSSSLYPFIMLGKVLGEPVSARARPFHEIIKVRGGKIQGVEENLKVHVQQTTFWLLLLQVNDLHPCAPKEEGRKKERKED